jgi:hypothetical protein
MMRESDEWSTLSFPIFPFLASVPVCEGSISRQVLRIQLPGDTLADYNDSNFGLF